MENPEDNPLENPEGNPLENPEGNPVENPEGNPVENPEGNPVENPEGNPVENPEGNPVENPEDSSEDEDYEDDLTEEQRAVRRAEVRASLTELLGSMRNLSSDFVYLFRLRFFGVFVLFADYIRSLNKTDFGPLNTVLQLCCNISEPSRYPGHALTVVSEIRKNMLYDFMMSCFQRAGPHAADLLERPLFPYLLECAQKQKLVLRKRKLPRFVPLYHVDWTGEERDSLRSFLKYGGWFELRWNEVETVMENILIAVCRAYVLSGVWDLETFRRLEDENGDPLTGDPIVMRRMASGFSRRSIAHDNEEVNELAACFKMFVDEADYPHAICSEKELNPVYRVIPTGQDLVTFYDSLYPGQRYGENVTESLFHLCKVTIRRTLHNNYELPGGIERLPVPRFIKHQLSNDVIVPVYDGIHIPGDD